MGTSNGGVVLDIKQDGLHVSGTAKMHEPALGMYEYRFTGTAQEGVALKLTPYKQSGNLRLGVVQAVCTIEDDGTLTGRWRSEVGTEGVFKARRHQPTKPATALPKANSVFLVHGHDEGAKHSVARFIEQLGVEPVILQEQINRGKTVIEKFEDFAARAGFAVVLMTPDDVGHAKVGENELRARPRQNVILELGYFAAKLGRSKTLVLVKGELEMPSDIIGLAYEPMDRGEGWKIRLARELRAAGFAIDLNKALI